MELMDRVSVTPEMRARVLENVRAAAPERKAKVVRFRSRRKFIALAACLAAVVIAASVLPKFSGNTEQPPVEAGSGIYQCASADELSKAVGFEAPAASYLPFEVSGTAYCNYSGDLAEVDYTGGDNSAALRKSEGKDDNSGDYNVYAFVSDISVGSLNVTLKGGSADSCVLAVWTDGGCSYSLSLSSGVSSDEWIKIISGVS
jgi:hypothetical protein